MGQTGIFVFMKEVMQYLPAGTVRLHGVMGERLEQILRNRLLKINFRHLVDPFRFRNETDGKWRCEFWGKIVISAADTYVLLPDPELKRILQDTVRDMLSTQTPDGNISSYPVEKQLSSWDIWGRKYVMLALARYYESIEQNPEIPGCLVKMLDNLLDQLGGRRLCEFGNHAGMAACSFLEALPKLYEITGYGRFLEFAEQIRISGCTADQNIFDLAEQGKAPSEIANGKAYEMTCCFLGLADLSAVLDRPELMTIVRKYYETVRDREIFITGGGGLLDQVGEYWGNGHDNQTRNDKGALGETCVTVSWIHLCGAVLRLSGDPLAAEQMMHSACNALMGAMSPNARFWCHANPTPLAGCSSKVPVWDQMARQGVEPFDGHDCCLAQGPEGLAFAAKNVCLKTPDGIAINYYEPFSASFMNADGARIDLEVESDYPFHGTVKIRLGMERACSFSVRLLIPSWQSKPVEIRLNQEMITAEPGAYAEIGRTWRDGDELSFQLDFTMRQIFSSDGNYTACLSGPILLSRDSVFGDLLLPVADGMKSEEMPIEPGLHCRLFHRLEDGSGMCDYMSAGCTFRVGHLLNVWCPRKKKTRKK